MKSKDTYSPDPLLIPPQKPDIEPHHWQEWLLSGVDPDIIRLNVHSLDGTDEFSPIDFFGQNIPKNKTPAFGGWPKWVLDQCQPFDGGGWVIYGDNGNEGDIWGQFKPDKPIWDREKQKYRKYVTPAKMATGIFCPSVSWRNGLKIAKKAGKEIFKAYAKRFIQTYGVIDSLDRLSDCDEGFWQWVIETPSLRISIVEGGKKAGSMLTTGHCAIGLPGIWNGIRSPKDEFGNKTGKSQLIPPLEPFAVKGRPITIVFDSDTQPKTVEAVESAANKTGTLFALKGCQVAIAQWDSSLGKGIDDVLYEHGEDKVDEIVKNAMPLELFRLHRHFSLARFETLKITQRYLSESLPLLFKLIKSHKILGLKSPKNTGKTVAISKIVEGYIAKGQRCLVITHRISLAKALAKAFGIDHIEEIKDSDTRGVLGYALCVDSAHDSSKAKFNPETWEDCVVVLDEVEQVLWHTLNAETDIKKHRVKVIENLQTLLQTVYYSEKGRIILSDADLSGNSLEYIEKLIGEAVKPALIVNHIVPYEGFKRTVTLYQGSDPSNLLKNLVQHIKEGGRPLIHTTGQKEQSTWGTINLESKLKKQFPSAKILRIDSDSTEDPTHPAYSITTRLHDLKKYDIVITSTVFETGISIDFPHFTAVYAINWGITPVNSCCQMVERDRNDIPRHIWIPERGHLGNIGNGGLTQKNVLASQSAACQVIKQQLSSMFDEIEEKPCFESLEAWSWYAAKINAENLNYRENVQKKLEADGYEIIIDGEEKADDAVKSAMVATKKENYQQYREEVVAKENPTDEQLEALEKKEQLTKDERMTIRKGKLTRRYQVEITPDLIEKDDKGYYRKLLRHYYLTVGQDYLKGRDESAIAHCRQEGGQDTIFLPDLKKLCLVDEVLFLKHLGIDLFFGTEKKFCKESLESWHKFTLENRWAIKAVLGVTIPEKSPIAAANALLGLLDLHLGESVQTRCVTKFSNIDIVNQKFCDTPREISPPENKSLRYYLGVYINNDNRINIFNSWLLRDRKEVEGGGTSTAIAFKEFQGQVKPQSDTTETAKIEHKYSDNAQQVATVTAIDWLLNVLQEVEKIPVASSRFTHIEPIISLIDEVESKFYQYQAQITQVCANYGERLWKAVGFASEILPQRE